MYAVLVPNATTATNKQKLMILYVERGRDFFIDELLFSKVSSG
jgi:hypothetical protein